MRFTGRRQGCIGLRPVDRAYYREGRENPVVGVLGVLGRGSIDCGERHTVGIAFVAVMDPGSGSNKLSLAKDL